MDVSCGKYCFVYTSKICKQGRYIKLMVPCHTAEALRGCSTSTHIADAQTSYCFRVDIRHLLVDFLYKFSQSNVGHRRFTDVWAPCRGCNYGVSQDIAGMLHDNEADVAGVLQDDVGQVPVMHVKHSVFIYLVDEVAHLQSRSMVMWLPVYTAPPDSPL